MIVEDVYIHESAVVDDGAKLGAGTKVWHFSHVMAGATIGHDCSLGQNVFVAGDVTVGHGCRIQNNVSIYDGVDLEDFVFCGPSMVFTNVRNPRSAYPTPTERYKRTRVKHGATIGANATVVCGTTIGEWAFVAAGAVITKDVEPHALMTGVPARRTGWMCECGLSLIFTDGDAVCISCNRAYREEGATIQEQL